MAAPDQLPKITTPLSRGSHPYMVRGTMATRRVERFEGRIEDILQSHRFRSGEELEQTILRLTSASATASCSSQCSRAERPSHAHGLAS